MIPRGTPRIGVAALVAWTMFAPMARADDHARTDRAFDDARQDTSYTFCKSPGRLNPRARELCPLASEIDDCKGFAKACDRHDAPKPAPSWLETVLRALTAISGVLVWVVIVGILLAILVPVFLVLRRGRTAKDATGPAAQTGATATRVVPEEVVGKPSDAIFGLAEAELARGELHRALYLFLAASLTALDERGAIRVARHRTNGEYVRSCNDRDLREPLREIVDAVDRVEFGHAAPSRDEVVRIGQRAARIVKAVAAITTLVLLVGCSNVRPGSHDDPAGDELVKDFLTRDGFTIERLPSSLATVPMPGPNAADAPNAIVIDATRVAVEREAWTHLLRWVDEGGTLLLFGDVASWPDELAVKPAFTKLRDVSVGDGTGQLVTGARTAHAWALDWPEAVTVAEIDDKSYAAFQSRGRGQILVVASADFVTNVGIWRRENARALVLLLDAVVERRTPLYFAQPEDGIPPPSNPFAALLRAGLGKALVHGLLAAGILFLAAGIRHARPRVPRRAARRAFTEHVEAAGAFMGRAGATAYALHAYARYAEGRLREHVRDADVVDFLAKRSGRDREEVKRLWNRATEAKPDDETRGDELATLRELHGLLTKSLHAV